MIRTLQSLAAMSSNGLLVDEPPAVLEDSDIRTYSAKGVHFAGSSDVSMALTPSAVSCLDSNVFLDALSLGKNPHPVSTLNNSEPISRLTLFSVHSQTALDSASTLTSVHSQTALDSASTLTSYASDTGVTMQSLPRTSSCVKAASEMIRRLDETEKWIPLLAVTIPHTRELSPIEQSNFSTTCRIWDATALDWAVDVCFKDDSTSTKNSTVCYCTQVDEALEVLVTLEERLDFYALYPNLYRDDQPSLVISITLAVLVGVFAFIAKVGQQLDALDAEREKVTTIRRLNRAKWTELEARTQTNNVFGDFDAYYVAQKQKRPENQPTITAHSESSASVHEVHVNGIERLQEPLDTSVQLPDEARTLFGSSARVNHQYRRVTLLFRVSNLALILLGIVLLFAGIEVHFVLGRTPAELVLYLYGGPVAVILVIGGAVLIAGGITGVLLARREASNAARTAYFTSLSAALLAQFLAVLFMSHILENFDAIPHGLALALRSKWDALSLGDKTQLQRSYGCCGFMDIKEEKACPEEALAVIPPRTCSVVLGSQASTLFSSSFVYVEALLLVEVVCVAVANFLIRWRQIRLVQLASGPEVPIVRSLVSTALLCSLPPLYALLSCAAISGVIFGVDLMVHWGAMADPVVSALFGVEIGVFIVTGAGVYLLLALWTLYALGRRDVRALRWVAGLFLAFILLTLAVRAYIGRLLADFYVDPLISQAVEAQYVALPRSTTLLSLEMAFQCCGFRSSSQGACVEGTSDTDVPTCREQVESALERALSISLDRLTGFSVAQAIMLILLAWLCFQLRQFCNVAGIRSVPSETESPEAYKPPSMSQKLCAGGLGVLTVMAVASGIGILCLGVDILLELNVLQISYLLRVFDRRLGVYLLIFGALMELFALFGGIVAWLTHQHQSRWKWVRKWAIIWYSLACVVLFVAAFVFAGVGHKLSTQFMFTRDGDKTVQEVSVDMRMKDLWSSAPSPTKLFVQNSLKCCGYERVRAANGSVSYTLQAEEFGWRRLSSTSIYHVYSEAKNQPSKTRMLTDTHTEAVRLDSKSQCPPDVSDGCASSMKQYVSRVARITWKLCAGLASYSVAALLCACGLYDTDHSERKWKPGWRLYIEQSTLLLSILAGLFTALACFIIGLDVAVNWTLFSSTALQMVFAKSMGVSLMLYGALALATHAYSMRAVLYLSVHQLFLQCVARFMLASTLFAAVGFTAYLSHYSSLSDERWQAQLAEFLDDQWSLLAPSTQNAIALEFSCCGFNDPVLAPGQGVVFDRPALGYPGCSLAISHGCKVPLMNGVESSFAWLFAFLLALGLLEIELMLLGALVLRDVRKNEREAWFALESRLRYVAGSFRREFQRSHVLVSIGARFDPRLTRTQRAMSVLCGWSGSLAVYAGHFATKGCYRTALKSCEQPGAGVLFGLGLAYGGAVGLAVQTATVALFEHIRHRTDEETQEVATARQRKEKVLLFRTPWLRRRPDTNTVTERPAFSSDASTLGTTQTTTEERWFVWLTRFVAVTFQACGTILFFGGCGLATLLGLLRLGYNNSLYGVPLDENVFELLALACGLIVVALLGAVANDMREQHLKRSYRRKATLSIVMLVIVAITAVLALGAVLLTVFMIHEVVQDDASALNSWSVRATGFSVAERLEEAWNTDLIGYAKENIQQEMRCCGFWDATNAPFLPCPEGDPVDITYEALSVSGTVLTKTKQEFTTLPGCRASMLARFQSGADVATYCALSAAGLLFLMILSSLFLARELVISKDASLKLRVPDSGTAEGEKRDVRETFETVVGLKIAAPTRGKLRSQILASSLDSVAPSMANELAAAPLNQSQVQIVPDLKRQGDSKDLLLEPSPGADPTDVPYPASIVYVAFAICLVWLVIMAYVVAISAMELGLVTSWRCVVAWSIGVAIQELVAEPILIFASIVARTLHHWWSRTLLARIIRRGRALLRIGPQDTKVLEDGASLTLYERLRYSAAVRIQRRLLTRITRARYLRQLRDRKQEQHRLLAIQRRDVLRKTLQYFTDEEIDAFKLLFTSADAAQLGLVSYTAIAKAVYDLGVHVPAMKVRELLEAFDPAYADLVDFEHFLYGMHCVREYHQQLETRSQENPEQPTSKRSVDEKLVSSSDRFGPCADPRAELLVKRQNLLRELHDRRESLAHKLMRKVSGRAPPQQIKSARTAPIHEDNEDLLSNDGETALTGTYVFWQNRKLSPKKRALESVLKKKKQEGLQTDTENAARAPVTLSPTKRAHSKITIPTSDSEIGVASVIECRDRDKVAPVVSEDFARRTSSSDVEGRAATEASEMPRTLPKAEEAKPFGAYMLLSKQPPFRPATSIDPNDLTTSPRPTTAEKPKPNDAQSALLKALNKHKSKK
ncbi:hypothetical protein DVH05_002969 [Phytophthora capsici]|nr:hypothetical protein DVH05_002969 [Phytophthora capsici]